MKPSSFLSLRHRANVCSEEAHSKHSSIVRSFLRVLDARFSATQVLPEATGPITIALILRETAEERDQREGEKVSIRGGVLDRRLSPLLVVGRLLVRPEPWERRLHGGCRDSGGTGVYIQYWEACVAEEGKRD